MNSKSGRTRFASLFVLLAAGTLLAAGFLPMLPATRVAGVAVPAPPLTPLPSINPKIGLHTRLTDEPSDANIEREFTMLRAMGGSWASEFFPWAYIQDAEPGRFNWNHADKVVDAANRAGVTVLARLDGVPAWARPAGTTWRYLDRDHYAAYAAFVHAFVAHFRGRLQYYIIWNEPNTAAEWGQRPPDPAAYADLLKLVYPSAKEADPGATVLLAGLAPNLEPEGSPAAMNDLVYLDRLYDAGARPFFDGVAVHAYGLKSAPDEPSGPGALNFSRTEEIHKTMVRRGDIDKPVFVTEGGWNDSPRWSFAVTPYLRTEYTVEAYRKANDEWPWCHAVCLWSSRLPTAAHTYMDNYTFITPDFIPKAVYLEVQRYATGENGTQR